jgi:insulysin
MSLASNVIWTTPAPNKNEPNSALTYYLHLGPTTSQRLRVTSALLVQILTEPAFNVLRTKEQLGYIVGCSPMVLPGAGHKGVRIIVQSQRGPGYLEERVEAFLGEMKGTIEEMSKEEFQEQKAGLTRKWTEESKNLGEELSKFWAHIDSGYLDFLRCNCRLFLHAMMC